MSIVSRLAAGPPKTGAKPCAVGHILAELAEDERAALASALANPEWTAVALTKVLNDEGIRVSHSTVLRHRKGECACEPG